MLTEKKIKEVSTSFNNTFVLLTKYNNYAFIYLRRGCWLCPVQCKNSQGW